MFDPDEDDGCLGTLALTRLLVRHLAVPIIATDGIMDGAGIASGSRGRPPGHCVHCLPGIVAAKAAREFGYGAQWAGQGAPLARALPAAERVRVLARELREAI